MWQYVTEHPFLFITLGTILLLLLAVVFLPFITEKFTMQWAYDKIEEAILNADCYSKLVDINAEMMAFRKSWHDTKKAVELWKKMRDLWDTQESKIFPKVNVADFEKMEFN